VLAVFCYETHSILPFAVGILRYLDQLMPLPNSYRAATTELWCCKPKKKEERKLWLLSFCVLFIMICHLSMLTWNIELQHECWNYISLFSSSLCVSALDKTFSIACKNYCFVTKMNRITRKESRTLTKMNVWSYNQCITSTTLWISVPKILYIYMQLSCALQIWTPFAYNFIWSTLFFCCITTFCLHTHYTKNVK